MQRLCFVINLGVHKFEDTHLIVVDIHFVLFADIWQLLARRINLMEIRICDQMTPFGRVSHIDMTFQGRCRGSWQPGNKVRL